MAFSTSDTSPTRLRSALALVWLATFAVAVLALDARATYGARTTSDEPQYLLTALSLYEDADLDIADELDDQRFLPFHELALNTQTIDLTDDGQRLSPHDPLLPVLLAPAMGVGGWLGAKMALAAIAGLAAVATAWTAVVRLQVGVATASTVVAALFVSPPLTSYATQVYPEMPAALAVIVAISALLGRLAIGTHVATGNHAVTGNSVTGNHALAGNHAVAGNSVATGGSGPRWRLDLVVMLAVIALPWLSVKYVPVAAVLAAALLLSAIGTGRTRALTIATTMAVAGGVYLFVHQRVYGGWTVYASGDHFVDGEFSVVGTTPNYLGRSRRLLGLLVDERFGLIAWNPVFVLLPVAMVAAIRRMASGRLVLLATVGAGWAVATWVALTMHGWWWPGRQVVVVLPVAVLALVVLADRGRRWWIATLGLSGIGLFNWLWLVVEASTGRRTLIVDFFETSNPLYGLTALLLPDHVGYALVDKVLTAGWAGVFGVLCLIGWRRSSPAADTVPTDPTPTDPMPETVQTATARPAARSA